MKPLRAQPGLYQAPDGALYRVMSDGTVYMQTMLKRHRKVYGKLQEYFLPGPWVRAGIARPKMHADQHPATGGLPHATVVDVRRVGENQEGQVGQIQATVARYCQQAAAPRGE